MNTNHHGHHPLPSSPTTLKKLAAKGQRPRASTTAPAGAASSSKIVARGEGGSGKNRNRTSEGCDEEGDGEMATSFLQFCAMCEKQIVVPNNSILYCSESCRRRDASKPFSPFHDNMYTPSPSSTPSSTPDSLDAFGITTPTIVPRRKPTPVSSSCSIPPVLHNAKSDLDPTEWKPDAAAAAAAPAFKRSDSEASKYLSQFHRSKSGSILPGRRPLLQTHMAASMIPTVMAAPSLSHTPTTSATSSSSSFAGTPYEFITPSAHAPGLYITPPTATIEHHNDVTSTDSSAPAVPPTLKAVNGKGNATCSPVSPTIIDGDVSYEKKWIAVLDADHVAVAGSLKKLLGYQEEGLAEAM